MNPETKLSVYSQREAALVFNGADRVERVEFELARCLQGDCEGKNFESNVEHLRSISKLENLISLNIKNSYPTSTNLCRCSYLQADLIEMIAELGRRDRLVEFSLIDHWLCTGDVVTAIGDYLPNLSRLQFEVGNCGDHALIHVIRRLTKLKHLRFQTTAIKIKGAMYPNDQISAEVFQELIKAAESNRRLESLHWIKAPLEKPVHFSFLIILDTLKELRINDCVVLPKVLEAWGSDTWSGRFRELEILDLKKCRFDDDSDTSGDPFVLLLALIRKLPKLRVLNLCWTMTETAFLFALAASPPSSLRELDVSGCKFVEFDGIQAMIDSCPTLERVGIPDYRWPAQLKVAEGRKVEFNW